MKSFLRALAFVALLLGLQDGARAVRPDDDHPHSRPRRRLEPNANIAAIIDEEISKGVKHPRFTLTAAIESTSQQNSLRSLSSGTAELFEVHVVLTDPSVSESTSISANGGESHSANITTKLLVADHHHVADESSSTFVILAVDEDNGSVKGIIQKDNRLVKWVQEAGETAVVSDASFNPPKDWTCGVDEIILDEDATRHLEKNRQHSREHDHHHSDSHDHDHFDLTNIKNFAELLGIEKMNLQSQQRRVYATDDWPNEYSYQVDMYIEVDTAMVRHHDPNDASNMPNTVAYINALMTDHVLFCLIFFDNYTVNVLHIASSTLYDSEPHYSTAFPIMKSHYRGDTTWQDSTWHYTNSKGRVPDLHHGILYNHMGGGIAQRSGVCNSYYGFALSGGVQGSITDINDIPSMFWDIIVVAHETGHNFGSGHTHNINDYNVRMDDSTPIIDKCGLKVDGSYDCKSTKDGSYVSSENYGTIMSYCHICLDLGGGGSTFGGIWNNGDRSDVNNWLKTKMYSTDKGFGNDPRRVSHHMYNYISSLGSCVKPYLEVDIQTCSADADCHDGVSCTTDTCVDGSCINVMNENCCGNLICEAGEEACSSDCGPFVLGTGFSSNTDVFISSLTMRLASGTSTVSLYTSNGGYLDNYENADSWTQIFSNYYSSSDLIITMDFNENVAVSAGSIQSFYIYSTGKVWIPVKTSHNPILVSDDNLNIYAVAKAGTALWSNVYGDEFSFDGSVHYSLPAPPPATVSPDFVASSAPSFSPSDIPSSSPSEIPSSQPSSTRCNLDTDCDDGVSCTTDTCVDGSCIYMMNVNCCGNFICEAGEEACSLDCGPFVLDTGSALSGQAITTFMFDVEADVLISRLTVKLTFGTSYVTVYTSSGGFADSNKYEDETEITMDFSESVVVSAGSIQSFYIYATGYVAIPVKSTDDPILLSDDNLKILALAKGEYI
eukprot:scaffold49680_cov63-Cyclotella_meneghiniana.AAC.2